MLRLVAGVVFFCAMLPAAEVNEFIFENAPFASAHASNIVELRNGDFLASWFGGSREGAPDVAIWSARRVKGKWSSPAVLVREPEIACYNPVIFYSKDGRLWFYYKFGPSPSTWSAGRRWSDDDGVTWSPVEHLPAGLYGPIRTKPLVLDNGVIVSGSSVESYGTWACWIERSGDNGKTWRRIGPITVPSSYPNQAGGARPYGIIQPSVIRVSGEHLRLYARSTTQIGSICIADSMDNGLSWTAARKLDLPNPNSGIDAVRLKDGRTVVAFNNSQTQRTPLNLAVSDDAEHFHLCKTLENGPGEFSYPSIAQARAGDLVVTYTWNRKRIRFRKIPLQDIK